MPVQTKGLSHMLTQKLDEDYKNAMREKNEVKVSTIRMLKSAVKNYIIDKLKKEASDEDVQSIIAKQIKQRRDSIEEFKKGNRLDLAEKEEKELGILEAYLPAQLSGVELEAVVTKVIAAGPFQSKADMGKVMKLVMEETKGRADGKAVSSLVASKLK